MKYVLDSHTHTLVSGHAYNTIREMTKMAKEKGLSLLAITEHCVAMPNAPHIYYFENYRVLDRHAYDVPTLFGVELNILDDKGTVDMEDSLMARMDVNIASLHPPCTSMKTKKEVTDAILSVLKNPHISIIGHLDDSRFPVDYDEVAKAAAYYHKLFEVNNSSLSPTSCRPGAIDNYKKLLDACMKYDVEIILNSDAHADTLVGAHQYSESLIESLQFPEEKIVNDSLAHYFSYLKPEIKNYGF